MSADTTYSGQALNYTAQGGAATHIGGSLVIDSGGSVDMSAVASLGTGTIRFDLASARLIATNDIPNNSATPPGGILTSNTGPAYKRVNGATDKAMTVQWASSSSVEIQLPTVPVPVDMDVTQAATLKLLTKMGGSTDTPTITADVFPGIGGTNAGGATSACASTLGEVTVTVAANSLTAYPSVISVALTPGAHTTDALNLYDCYLEYAKKTS